MNPNTKMFGLRIRGVVAVLCALSLVSGDSLANIASPQSAQVSSPQSQAPLIPPDQLDSLVAPIALYPDPLLAQTLAASTYPLELIQLQQWLAKNPGLKDKALADTVAKQTWDPSIQAMAALPDVVKRLADDIQWTTDLGNAFLAQQSGVMDAVQRMRKKAQETGNLKSTEQQKVETKVIENKSVIVVEQANPQVIYVPSYDPYAVYGPPIYPYPPIYYPPAGYYAAATATTSVTGTPAGSIIRSIAAALRIATKLRQTGLVVRLAEIRWPTVRLRPGTRLAGRAAIWPAIAPKELAEAIEPAMELVR